MEMTIKSMLDFSLVYNVFQRLTGADRLRKVLVKEYIKPEPGIRLLDIGCGTAEILRYLPEVCYYGFDLSEKYIAQARKCYGHRGHFECKGVSDETAAEYDRFDLVLAIGVLHHLDDNEVNRLFRLAHGVLNHGGRLITMDCCYAPQQSAAARWMVSQDRGQHVRTVEGYRQAEGGIFSAVTTEVRFNLLNIIYPCGDELPEVTARHARQERRHSPTICCSSAVIS